MKNIIAGLILFSLQIYLTLLGVTIFGKFLNPVLLFIVSAAIPAYFIWLHLRKPSGSNAQKQAHQIWIQLAWAMIGLISIVVAFEELRKVFALYSEVEKWSDVIPQVRTLYERFTRGELPYAPIPFPGYDLQPIYMPFHWLPVGLAAPLHVDIRWVGFGMFALSAALYGWSLIFPTNPIWVRIIVLILPSLPLWAYFKWAPADLSVTYEIVIGAYYLVLATGLLTKRLWLVTVGIILCLLSRYTLIFWLPLFACLLFYEKGIKKSFVVWGAVASCFIIFYLIPFYSKDPSMVTRGFRHYMNATVGDWQGSGDPPVSWTQEQGISFAPLMKATFKGEMSNRVYWARVVHGITLLLSLLIAIWSYRRWRDKMDMFTFCLAWLYIFMMVYYFFAPLTYRYYLFSFLVVSALLIGKIILHETHRSEKQLT